MIVKIASGGDDATGLALYLTGPGNHREHTNPRVVTGTIGRPGPLSKDDAFLLAEDLQAYKRVNDSRIKGGHVWHSAVSIGPKDGQLPMHKWEGIAEDFMEHMGFDNRTRWVAVHHGVGTKGNDHVHIMATLVREDGSKISRWRERIKAQEIAKELEPRYGLSVLAGRHTGVYSREYSKNDSGRAKNQGTEPRRGQIERMVRTAASGATSETDFIANLTRQGLGYKPYVKEGKVCGYSVNLPDTTTAKGKEHWWAGGKLARDLSYPRLKQWWDQGLTAAPTHITAVAELTKIKQQAPLASPAQLADSAHQLSNALAAASTATEPSPAALAQMSRRMSTLAQTKTYTWEKKPPALSAGVLFQQCTDPTGPVGQAVMIRQLLAASLAVLDAHLARARVRVLPEGAPSMYEAPEDEVVNMAVTTGTTMVALGVEGHARRRLAEQASAKPRSGWEAEPWDRNTIARMAAEQKVQQAHKAFRPPPPPMSAEQRTEIARLSAEIDLPVQVEHLNHMSSDEATLFIADLARAQGPVTAPIAGAEDFQDPDSFLADLEARQAGRKQNEAEAKAVLLGPVAQSGKLQPVNYKAAPAAQKGPSRRV